MYQVLLKSFLLITLLLLAGCGYQLGTVGNPQFKSIAIAPIKNETNSAFAATYMKQKLAERFQVDGTYKITNMKNADAILYGQITTIDITAQNIMTSPNAVTFQTNEFGATVTFQYVLIIPGRATPAVPSTSVSGNAQFQVPVDLFPARSQGIRQACRDAAEKVVWRCAEGW
ncbi:MAG: hypothetical protein K9L78_05560 [Victivallales bacterium]|nr:hypothetical protein [Victivallales bacterium]MCF7889569.1 hypothetical protein [Victivallales bacterium]